MADPDLRLHEQAVREALYGGPALPPALLRKFLLGHCVTLPSLVMCVATDRQLPLPAALSRRVRTLRLHAGLTICHMRAGDEKRVADALDRAAFRRGRALTCAKLTNWIHVTQQAVLSLRDAELATLLGDRGRAVTLIDEQKLRQLATQRIRSGERSWPEALGLWVEIVLYRHRGQLNAIRRKIVEFLAGLTSSVDVGSGLEFIFWQSLRRIDQAFTLSEFPALVREIVAALEPHIVQVQPRASPDAPSGALVTRALELIRERFKEPLSTRDVAEHLDVTPEYLARAFKKHVHRGVIDLLHALRVGHAQRQLVESADSVLDIALDSGFGSVEHFHRIFRRETGLSPGQYRAQHRG